jgi:hypothetical protein
MSGEQGGKPLDGSNDVARGFRILCRHVGKNRVEMRLRSPAEANVHRQR